MRGATLADMSMEEAPYGLALITRTYLKIEGGESIRYKRWMIRLLDSEWERIRERFPEENIPDGRPRSDCSLRCSSLSVRVRPKSMRA